MASALYLCPHNSGSIYSAPVRYQPILKLNHLTFPFFFRKAKTESGEYSYLLFIIYYISYALCMNYYIYQLELYLQILGNDAI